MQCKPSRPRPRRTRATPTTRSSRCSATASTSGSPPPSSAASSSSSTASASSPPSPSRVQPRAAGSLGRSPTTQVAWVVLQGPVGATCFSTAPALGRRPTQATGLGRSPGDLGRLRSPDLGRLRPPPPHACRHVGSWRHRGPPSGPGPGPWGSAQWQSVCRAVRVGPLGGARAGLAAGLRRGLSGAPVCFVDSRE
jgi:hypothetical protein